MQDGEPDPKPQEMAPIAREAERFQDGCWSSKRCLRDKRGQEKKIGRERERRERGTQLGCACGTNKHKVREMQCLSEHTQ